MMFFANIVQTLISIYEILIIIWCILSWIPMRHGGLLADFATVINSLVSPYMNIFRRIIPPLAGIDFSPVIGILVLSFLSALVR